MTFSFNVKGLTPQDAQNQGSGGSGTTVVETLSPTNCAGCSLWLDGQCNTRQGNDHSKKYMENLVWNMPLAASQTNREVFPAAITNNIWKGDFLKTGTYSFYPLCTSGSLTLELVFLIDEDFLDSDMANPYRQDSTQGFATLVNVVSTGLNLQFYAHTLNSDENQIINHTIERNKKYYFAGTINNKDLKTYLNGDVNTLIMPSTYAKNTKTDVYSGIGLGPNGTDSQRWKGLNLGMLRIWNRVLTDSEIQTNYADAKRRFNF